ncbi:hypothetical protein ORIO_13895 [Cereibacter azotoformans]|uniref:Uncharacterized protein n=2 Tax=Cereibacter TaxID=1653176 RepID=A0A2T5JVC3_9RHOB|nr:hypothetical protein [Cereibacter azotoformans]AXQ94773.1 hypothetical protein D0Z66_13730 [Cereibacter sphaeroides]MBO4170369.1 hypothetical protein [Cereibacter azotoformans]PTR14072.1 hypothetical protein C8J28_11867 [Cereibacter azotoformans]UIJ30339.1 hypothetical protein LV780_13700 [Cereibacter azotoformans]ULB10996.1 hypothetical protein ORIO_13895 [Cereibacter azotoformans]
MAFGIVFSSLVTGLSLAVWGLWQGYSIPAALLLHMMGGTLGALLFLGIAVMRPTARQPYLRAEGGAAN